MKFFNFNRAEAWIEEKERQRLKNVNTNVYIWGEGQQVECSQDYSNFTPKNLKPFRGKNKPNIIDIAFGWYHEAYIDNQGKLYVCKKPKMTSIRIEEIDDKDRTDLQEVTSLPQNTKVNQVSFTRTRMFVLTEKGEVYVYRINEELPNPYDIDHFSKNTGEIKGTLDVKNTPPTLVKDLKNIKMIATGSDHFLALNKEGEVFAMGDDTFGQCGQGGEGRSATAPFFEKRFGKPVQVKFEDNKKIKKIVSGYRHSLAITEKGELYGWGYNNQQQLSHGEEYSSQENPQHAIFTPAIITNNIENKQVLDASCGEEFSIILVQNYGENKVQEIYATGNNLRGQLGINRVSHLQDLTLIEDLSGFVDLYKDKPLNINHISCGRKHCIATFDYGAFFIWGDNEFGQLGDKKRRFLESPYPKSKFEKKHNVENVICGINSCAVIVEDLESDKTPLEQSKKEEQKKKKKKRTIKQADMITNLEELKLMNESKIVKQKDGEIAQNDKQNLGEKIRGKWHTLMYGDSQIKTSKEKSEVQKEKQLQEKQELDQRTLEQDKKK